MPTYTSHILGDCWGLCCLDTLHTKHALMFRTYLLPRAGSGLLLLASACLAGA